MTLRGGTFALGRVAGLRGLLVPCALTLLLAACEREPEIAEPEIRPVRTVVVAYRDTSVPIVLTGVLQARDEAGLSFRIAGRMIERLVNRGDVVEPGQVLALLDAVNERNALRAAEANLAAARGQLTQAENHYERQRHLLDRGFTTRAAYDDALQSRQTAQSQVQAAQAQLRFAQDQVAFTELRADAEGVVIAIGAEPGEVVQVGQMIAQLAREGGRDAVIDVPAQIIREAPGDPEVTIFLTSDPTVYAKGRVREVSPLADPVTRTFEVKIGIIDPPEAMRLGATITARIELEANVAIEIPATALTRQGDQPAVWVVDPDDFTVSLRQIEVSEFGPARVGIFGGLEPGEIVVVAGVQALHPGQKVRLLEEAP